MKVLITGAAGFVGRNLGQAIASAGGLVDINGQFRTLTRLVLADRVAAQPPPALEGFAQVRTADLGDPAAIDALAVETFDTVFHLAACLTAEAERYMAAALAVNVAPLMRMLEVMRRAPKPPKLVFASSIAVFGGELPVIVAEDVAKTPTTSYGTHKAISELLIDDYSRHGVIDGRSLRLPIVVTRPRAATPTVSDKVAGIIREPLLGRAVVCPFSGETMLPLASVQRAAQAMVTLHDLPAKTFGATRAMNMPALTVKVDDMIAAVRRRAGARVLGEISMAPDPMMAAIVAGWPKRFISRTAAERGIEGDRDIDEIVTHFAETVGLS